MVAKTPQCLKNATASKYFGLSNPRYGSVADAKESAKKGHGARLGQLGEMQAKTRLVCPVSVSKIVWQTGVAMWSRLLALALLLLPALALAGAKEKVAALAPSGLVLVMDEKGNGLVVQNADEPSSRPPSPRS